MANNYIESIKVAIGTLLRQPSEDGDAIQMLMADHRRVDQLVSEFEHAEEQEKKSICMKILLELTVHAKLEEELVYPLLRSEGEEEKDQVDEALIEHECVKYLIGELEGKGPSDDKFDARIKVLGELVKHHVKEEESDMLPELRASGKDMNVLGDRLAKRKAELLQQLHKKPTLSSRKNGKAAPARGNGSARATRGTTAKGKATKAKAVKATSKRTSTAKAKTTASRGTAKGSTSKSKASASRGKVATKSASRSSSAAKKPASSKKGAASKGRATASKSKASAAKTRSKSR